MFPCFLFLCFLAPMPPTPVVPDGAGGMVPFTNARVLPDGSLRPYDPSLDGVMLADSRIVYPYAPYPEPQGHVTVGPPEPLYRPPPMAGPDLVPKAPNHAHKPSKPPSGGASCYGPDGRPTEPVPQGCATQGAPPLERESHEPDRGGVL
jgi:hypothetical protein